MNNQKQTQGKFTRNTRFNHSKRSSGFHGRPSRFTAKSNRPKSQTLDISSFINRAVASRVPEKAFTPKYLFTDFKLNPVLLRSIIQKKYIQPTPIQDKIIPSVLEGKDMVGLANTGTGKTAAFLIPLIERVLRDQRGQILIVTPTRELALQIEEELESITRQMRIYSTVCVGGEYIGIQVRKLKRKNNFIIGTPGRLIDLVNRKILKLNGTHTVVLDEADRMLDMGFIKDIRLLVSHTPEERQTLCFSATM